MTCRCVFVIPICEDEEDHRRRMNEDSPMSNVFDNQTGDRPPTEYRDLHELVAFSDFDYDNYLEGEAICLTPQLEALGYTDVVFHHGERDSFGPLTRICSARKDGQQKWFVYG